MKILFATSSFSGGGTSVHPAMFAAKGRARSDKKVVLSIVSLWF